MATTVCALCGKAMDEYDLRSGYRQVTGYVGKREGGGANAIRLRVETGKAAHRMCVDREARKINANQESML